MNQDTTRSLFGDTPADMPLPIVRTWADLRTAMRAARAQGKRTALVPTMGALHAGHLSLIAEARRDAEFVAASIFVNPTQFGPGEDFARYPRDEDTDSRLLAGAGCDLLYAPTVDQMYPQGEATRVVVDGITEGLCGAFRPGHFTGVATVVAKLLIQAEPDLAVFGEKDYQQLLVIKRMAADLCLPVTIRGAPILREADGLAMSSRNAYLSASQRERAADLPRILSRAAAAMEADPSHAPDHVRLAIGALEAAGFDAVQYVELRDAETLGPVVVPARRARLLAAVILGTTRLIDNWPVDPRS